MLVLFIVATVILRATARNFVFNGSTRISRLENWLNKDYPCQGDKIIFEENKKTVALIDQSIQVSSIILPQVGSLVFSDNAVLGEKSRWQCTHRKSPENVFFQTDTEFAGFSDPASWITDDKPLLHMNMVPGALDDVIFHDMGAFQISIDDQVTVNSLRVSKDWTDMINSKAIMDVPELVNGRESDVMPKSSRNLEQRVNKEIPDVCGDIYAQKK